MLDTKKAEILEMTDKIENKDLDEIYSESDASDYRVEEARH